MNPITAWQHVVLKNYANFNGRARRSEYWYFALANIIVYVILMVLGSASSGFAIITLLYGLGVIVPGLAVGVRRLHDIGKSGAWILIALIPIVGSILLLVWTATDSHRGTNQWGVSAKYPV